MKGRQSRKLSQQVRGKEDPILPKARLGENMCRVERGKNELVAAEKRLIVKSLGPFKNAGGVLRAERVAMVGMDRSDDPGRFDHRSTQLARFVD